MPNTSHTVVLHASDEPTDVSKALAAVQTLLAARPGLSVRVIVNGPALDGVLSTAPQIDPAFRHLVHACQLGMQRRNLPVDGLQEGINTVPSAVVALSDAQLEGAAYIRI